MGSLSTVSTFITEVRTRAAPLSDALQLYAMLGLLGGPQAHSHVVRLVHAVSFAAYSDADMAAIAAVLLLQSDLARRHFIARRNIDGNSLPTKKYAKLLFAGRRSVKRKRKQSVGVRCSINWTGAVVRHVCID